MAHRILPNSTPTVMRCLLTANAEWKRTPVAAERALPAELWPLLDDTNPASLYSRLLLATGKVSRAVAAQSVITDTLATKAAQTGMFVSHFHQVFDFGVARGTFKAGARSYYQRPVAATAIPDVSTYDAIAREAANIVQGEADRATAEGHPATFDSGLTFDSGVRFDSSTGYRAMDLPSAAEVGALAAEFKTLRDESDRVQVDTDRQREAVQALMPEALALTVDLCDGVEYFYRHDPDDSSRRQKCERWGVAYATDAAPVTPTPTPTPTPPA